MRRLIIAFALLYIMVLPTFAQEEALVCRSPFTTNADPAQSVMTLDEVQITPNLFANRVRFEHAYNAVKLEIRVTQLTQEAEDNTLTPAELIAGDAQVQQINAETDDLLLLGNRVLSELASDVVVWDYASENGITVTQSLFDETLNQFFDFDEATTEEERQATVDDFARRILASGTIPQEITTFFCRQAIYDQVQATVIPSEETTLYANVAHILVSTQAVAQDIITLLASGDSFENLVQQLSLDVPTVERDGEIGFQPAVFFPPTFADAVTTAELNTIVGPVQTQFGWHVLRILEREDRAIEDNMREQIESTRFSRWRGEQINRSDIAINPEWQLALPSL